MPTVPISTETNPQNPPQEGPQEGQTPPEGAQQATDAARAAVEEAREAVDDATGQGQGGSDVAGLRREAAGYRRRLREAERERDGLRERVDDHDRREVERLAGEHLAEPADLWLASSLDVMRTDDGALDREKVGAELARVTSEKPHWSKANRPNFHQGARALPVEPPSFGQALKSGGR